MLTAREAISKAQEACKEYFNEAVSVSLEEVEKDEAEKFWLITLSYLERVTQPSGLRGATSAIASMMNPDFIRKYKV